MRKLAALLLLAVGSGALALAVNPAPEIDPASGGSALTLLAGAVLIWRGRRRK